MILNKYQDLFFVFFLFLAIGLLLITGIDWPNISLGILGFVWEYARNHEKLKQRSLNHKYRFSFIRVFYNLNDLLKKIPFLVYLGATLFILPIFLFSKPDIFIGAPLIGTFTAFLINLLKSKYEVH